MGNCVSRICLTTIKLGDEVDVYRDNSKANFLGQ